MFVQLMTKCSILQYTYYQLMSRCLMLKLGLCLGLEFRSKQDCLK